VGSGDIRGAISNLTWARPRTWAEIWARLMPEVGAALLLSLPFFVMILATKLRFRLIGDEAPFHMKVIEALANDWPRINLADYSSASTPLSYILLTAFGKVVGFEIWKLRLFSTVATFIASYLFYRLARKLRLPYPMLCAFILVFFPYIFFSGYTIYPASFALFFGVAALDNYLMGDGSLRKMLMGSVFATLAILCSQAYIILPASFLAVEVLGALRRGSMLATRWAYSRLIVLAIPILSFVPLVLLWGGFTSPSNRAAAGGDWYLELNPQQLNFTLIFVGFYFFPVVLRRQSRDLLNSWRWVVPSAATLFALYRFFPIVLEDGPDRFLYMAGVVIRGLDIVRRSLGGGFVEVAMLGLWLAGLLIVLGELSERMWSVDRIRLAALALGYVGLMALSPFVYERYYLILVPPLILFLYRSYRRRWVVAAWTGVQALLALVFSYWQIALK